MIYINIRYFIKIHINPENFEFHAYIYVLILPSLPISFFVIIKNGSLMNTILVYKRASGVGEMANLQVLLNFLCGEEKFIKII